MSKVEPLFKELDNFLQNEEWENAVHVCDKILVVSPLDSDALQCKCIALIQQSKAAEALQVVELAGEGLQFERAYCYYSAKRLEDALQVLQQFPAPHSVKVLELEAQVYYGLEQHHKAIEVYEVLRKDHKMDTPELLTNLFAAHIASGKGEALNAILQGVDHKNLLQSSWEYTYNAACMHLEAKDFAVAEKYLMMAEGLCGKYLKEEMATEEEIEIELAIIHAQLGFIYQIQGKIDEATQIYNSIVKSKLFGESAAIASNNIVVIHKERDLFDSHKKLKQASTASVEQKLSVAQNRIIGFNHCLLLLHMNKAEQCTELVKVLQSRFPNEDRLPLVFGAVYYKDKKLAKTEEILNNYAAQHPESVRVQLSLAQIHLDKGNVLNAIQRLENIISLKNKPGMVATLISLYEQINDVQGAAKTLDAYLSTWEAQKGDEDQFISILKASANFKLKHSKFREAADLFERIIRINPNDLEALPGLVIAYSQFDPQRAAKNNMRIPQLTGEQVDVDALENLTAPKLGIKATSTESGDIDKKVTVDGNVKKKKNKRKKRHTPKDSSQPDPERWIPLKQRSSFKRKMKKGNKGLEKGAQGGVNIGRSVIAEKEKTAEINKQEKESKEEAPPPKQAQPQPKAKSNAPKKKKVQKKRR